MFVLRTISKGLSINTFIGEEYSVAVRGSKDFDNITKGWDDEALNGVRAIVFWGNLTKIMPLHECQTHYILLPDGNIFEEI